MCMSVCVSTIALNLHTLQGDQEAPLPVSLGPQIPG